MLELTSLIPTASGPSAEQKIPCLNKFFFSFRRVTFRSVTFAGPNSYFTSYVNFSSFQLISFELFFNSEAYQSKNVNQSLNRSGSELSNSSDSILRIIEFEFFFAVGAAGAITSFFDGLMTSWLVAVSVALSIREGCAYFLAVLGLSLTILEPADGL